MTVSVIIRDGKFPPLTDEQRAEIRKAAASPIVYDEDCPELTDEELSRFRRPAEDARAAT